MPPPADRMQTPRILWLALLVSVLLFPVILFVIRSTGGSVPAEPAEPMLLPVLAFAAFGCLGASFLVPAAQRRAAFGRLKLDLSEVADDSAMPMYGQQATRKVIADRGRALAQVMPSYTTTFILTLALRESVATIGFVVGMLGFDLVLTAPFFAVAVVTMLIELPSAERVLAQLAKVHGVGLPPGD